MLEQNELVLERAIALFEGNETQTQVWFNQPNRALEWKTPAEVLVSESGVNKLLKLITRLEHGVYS